MFEGFNPTKKEREAIERAFQWILDHTRDNYRSEQFAKDEQRGYGNANDRVPLIAAKAICVKWFVDGGNQPNQPLREVYYCRPAALWFQGMGAEYNGKDADNRAKIAPALAAYDAAFKRMQEMDEAR